MTSPRVKLTYTIILAFGYMNRLMYALAFYSSLSYVSLHLFDYCNYIHICLLVHSYSVATTPDDGSITET